MRTIILAASLVALAIPAAAGEYNTGYFGNVAIEGYDTVSYFDGDPMPGDPDIAYEWKGVEWHFASAANRDKFIADPAAYAPQFGGLCTEGVAFNEISANLMPETYEIIDGKLYLNYGTYWLDLKGNLPKSEANWPGVHALLAQ